MPSGDNRTRIEIPSELAGDLQTFSAAAALLINELVELPNLPPASGVTA